MGQLLRKLQATKNIQQCLAQRKEAVVRAADSR